MTDKLKREDFERPGHLAVDTQSGDLSVTLPEIPIHLSDADRHAIYAALRQTGRYDLINKIARQAEAAATRYISSRA